MNSSILQINTFDKINILDLFLTTADRWIDDTIYLLLRIIDLVFNTNNYANWKALPVRGPDVALYIAAPQRDYSFI